MDSTTLAQQAADLNWGLDAGMDTVADAVAWADRMLADPEIPYSEELFNVSTGGKLSAAEMRTLLGRLERPEGKWPVIRRFIGRMADALAATPEKAFGFALFFERMALLPGDNPASVPSARQAAYQFIYEYDMAEAVSETTGQPPDLRAAQDAFREALALAGMESPESASQETRPANPEERALMRAVARENGASLRQPLAWLRHVMKGVFFWPLAWLLCGAAIMYMALPIFIIVKALRPLFDSGVWESVEIHLCLIVAALAFSGVPLLALIGHLRSNRSITKDAFPGDSVEVWSVRGATAVRHEKNTWGTHQGCPEGSGDSLYFDLTDGGVFCLSGADWRAFAENGQPSATLCIGGTFPSSDFDVVVMPRCRKAIRIVGRGEALPMAEYDYQAVPVAMDFRQLRDNYLGENNNSPTLLGQAGVIHPYRRPWEPAPPSVAEAEAGWIAADCSATHTLRKATPAEQEQMRQRALASGATPRAPGPWFCRVLRSLGSEWALPAYFILLIGYVGMGLAVVIHKLISQWFGWALPPEWGYWIAWIVVPGAVLAVATVRFWKWSRSVYQPIRIDAFANDEVEVWRVRTRGAAHLLRGGMEESEFVPQKRGSWLYFDLAAGDVLALEGADWVALARGQTPEDLKVEGVFPSDEFELVVAPHSRRILTVYGKGRALPFHEWMDRWGDDAPAHRAFHKARDDVRPNPSTPRRDQVFIFRPSARPWDEVDHD